MDPPVTAQAHTHLVAARLHPAADDGQRGELTELAPGDNDELGGERENPVEEGPSIGTSRTTSRPDAARALTTCRTTSTSGTTAPSRPKESTGTPSTSGRRATMADPSAAPDRATRSAHRTPGSCSTPKVTSRPPPRGLRSTATTSIPARPARTATAAASTEAPTPPDAPITTTTADFLIVPASPSRSCNASHRRRPVDDGTSPRSPVDAAKTAARDDGPRRGGNGGRLRVGPGGWGHCAVRSTRRGGECISMLRPRNASGNDRTGRAGADRALSQSRSLECWPPISDKSDGTSSRDRGRCHHDRAASRVTRACTSCCRSGVNPTDELSISGPAARGCPAATRWFERQ